MNFRYNFRHFVKTRKNKHTAVVGIDAAILLTTAVSSIGVMALFANQIANIVQGHYLGIAFFVPKFHNADGSATSILGIYTLLQEHVFEYFFIGSFMLILILLFTDTTKLTNGKAKGMIIKVFGIAIMVMLLPTVWDIAAVQVERSALWLINPLYQFDPKNPCGNEEQRDRIFSYHATSESGGKSSEAVSKSLAPILEENVKIARELGNYKGTAEEFHVCSPELRLNYLFHKAVFGLALDVVTTQDDVDFFTWLTNSIQGIGFAVFGSVTRSVIVSFILLSATVVMVGKNIWLMTILSLFPMIAIISVFPHIGEFADKLMKMIPPLLMTGVITAGLLLAGSSAVYSLEIAVKEDTPLYGIEGFNSDGGKKPVKETVKIDNINAQTGKRNSGIGQGAQTVNLGIDTTTGQFDDSLIFWFAAIGTLALAGTIPVMMVPALGQFASQVSQAVQTGLISGAQASQQAISAGASAAGAAAKEAKGGGEGGTSALAGLGKMLGAGAMGAMAGAGQGDRMASPFPTGADGGSVDSVIGAKGGLGQGVGGVGGVGQVDNLGQGSSGTPVGPIFGGGSEGKQQPPSATPSGAKAPVPNIDQTINTPKVETPHPLGVKASEPQTTVVNPVIPAGGSMPVGGGNVPQPGDQSLQGGAPPQWTAGAPPGGSSQPPVDVNVDFSSTTSGAPMGQENSIAW